VSVSENADSRLDQKSRQVRDDDDDDDWRCITWRDSSTTHVPNLTVISATLAAAERYVSYDESFLQCRLQMDENNGGQLETKTNNSWKQQTRDYIDFYETRRDGTHLGRDRSS